MLTSPITLILSVKSPSSLSVAFNASILTENLVPCSISTPCPVISGQALITLGITGLAFTVTINSLLQLAPCLSVTLTTTSYLPTLLIFTLFCNTLILAVRFPSSLSCSFNPNISTENFCPSVIVKSCPSIVGALFKSAGLITGCGLSAGLLYCGFSTGLVGWTGFSTGLVCWVLSTGLTTSGFVGCAGFSDGLAPFAFTVTIAEVLAIAPWLSFTDK